MWPLDPSGRVAEAWRAGHVRPPEGFRQHVELVEGQGVGVWDGQVGRGDGKF